MKRLGRFLFVFLTPSLAPLQRGKEYKTPYGFLLKLELCLYI